MPARGFTLVEALAVMTILAVLAAVAIPGYQRAVQRAHRTDARLALLRIQYLQERHYAEHHVYAGSMAELAGGAGAAVSDQGDYDLSVSADPSAQTFVAQARARIPGRQAGDTDCRGLSLDHSGTRRNQAMGMPWRDTDPSRCWG